MNNLEALIECYLDICQYEKKLSQDTLKAYRTDLAQFRAFVGGAEVSRDLLSQYIKYLNKTANPYPGAAATPTYHSGTYYPGSAGSRLYGVPAGSRNCPA